MSSFSCSDIVERTLQGGLDWLDWRLTSGRESIVCDICTVYAVDVQSAVA
jgi:hypothetical protein